MLAVLAGLIMLLDKVMPNWGAALVVGVVVGIIGWLLIGKARAALEATDITPQQTVETLKEDAAWVKQQIK
jgi:membrane-bound ClpP family serine protease